MADPAAAVPEAQDAKCPVEWCIFPMPHKHTATGWIEGQPLPESWYDMTGKIEPKAGGPSFDPIGVPEAQDGREAANDCRHDSATGIDTAAFGPDKVWRCDHCGLRWRQGAYEPVTPR